MKIEKTGENQIRCILTSEDLAARQLSVNDLAYGSPKARRLFREMMSMAVKEVDFQTDGMPIMIEAIPLMSNGIMLIITRVENPEELDTRFSRFTQPSDSSPDDDVAPLRSDGSPLSTLYDLIKNYVENQANYSADEIRCFRFNSITDVIRASRRVKDIFKGESSLYKSSDGYYFLTLFRVGSLEDFNNATALLSEFGSRVLSSNATPSYYEEHYERLIPCDVFEALTKN